jgi:uroporphyrinogen-III synthase
MKVWVTRSQPGAATTADRLTALGHEPLVAPLLQVRQFTVEPDPSGVSALAFTSANAIRAFEPGFRDLPVFTVGETTAQAALKSGFTDVHAGPSDVAALGALIVAALPPGALVLHPCAVERAGDLETPLAAAGIRLWATPVYETVYAPVDAAVLAALAAAEAVLLHSAKAARALNALMDAHPAPARRILCLSAAVAGAVDCGKMPDVAFATLPNDGALLNLL